MPAPELASSELQGTRQVAELQVGGWVTALTAGGPPGDQASAGFTLCDLKPGTGGGAKGLCWEQLAQTAERYRGSDP